MPLINIGDNYYIDKHSVSSHQISAFKGLMIFFVMIGHNIFITKNIDYVFSYVYLFHILCFFSLVNLFDTKFKFCKHFKIIIIYLILYIFFSIIYNLYINRSVLCFCFVHSLFLSFISGNIEDFKNISGFSALWFIPAYILYLIIRSIIPNNLLVMISFIFHIFLSSFLIKIGFVNYFSVLSVMYIYIICEASIYIWKINNKDNFKIWAFLFLLFSSIVYFFKLKFNMSSGLLFGCDDLFNLIIHDAFFIISFIFFMLLASILSQFKMIVFLGENSLWFYFTHQIVLYGYVVIFNEVSHDFFVNFLNVTMLQIFTVVILKNIYLVINKYFRFYVNL